jgi:hypothetical protein
MNLTQRCKGRREAQRKMNGSLKRKRRSLLASPWNHPSLALQASICDLMGKVFLNSYGAMTVRSISLCGPLRLCVKTGRAKCVDSQRPHIDSFRELQYITAAQHFETV